jgi:hypothetical protein
MWLERERETETERERERERLFIPCKRHDVYLQHRHLTS